MDAGLTGTALVDAYQQQQLNALLVAMGASVALANALTTLLASFLADYQGFKLDAQRTARATLIQVCNITGESVGSALALADSMGSEFNG